MRCHNDPKLYTSRVKIRIITVGEPKLPYAKQGWEEYTKRLSRFHQLQVTHLSDKWAYDPERIRAAIGKSYCIALVIDGKQFTSQELADFLESRSNQSREICFIIGGPEGLPQKIIDTADVHLGLSRLTFPHDLAMLILTEALYRASAINAHLPYHK